MIVCDRRNSKMDMEKYLIIVLDMICAHEKLAVYFPLVRLIVHVTVRHTHVFVNLQLCSGVLNHLLRLR